MKLILTNSFSVKWVVWQAKSVINRFCGYLQTHTLENSRAFQFHYIIQTVSHLDDGITRVFLCIFLASASMFSHKNK